MWGCDQSTHIFFQTKLNTMLLYTTLGGDVLIFKGKDTLTICRGNWGKPIIKSIEVDGEQIKILKNPNPFTMEEVEYFMDQYDSIVGPRY